MPFTAMTTIATSPAISCLVRIYMDVGAWLAQMRDEALTNLSWPGYCFSRYGKVAPACQVLSKSREGVKTVVAS